MCGFDPIEFKTNSKPFVNFDIKHLKSFLKDKNRYSFTFCYMEVLNSFSLLHINKPYKNWDHQFQLMVECLTDIYAKGDK